MEIDLPDSVIAAAIQAACAIVMSDAAENKTLKHSERAKIVAATAHVILEAFRHPAVPVDPKAGRSAPQ